MVGIMRSAPWTEDEAPRHGKISSQNTLQNPEHRQKYGENAKLGDCCFRICILGSEGYFGVYFQVSKAFVFCMILSICSKWGRCVVFPVLCLLAASIWGLQEPCKPKRCSQVELRGKLTLPPLNQGSEAPTWATSNSTQAMLDGDPPSGLQLLR